MKIMEVTLRDGSYAINFQFTASDTAAICAALEKAGFDLIEIGHGVGMHASEAGYGQAVETDEAYLQAAAGILKKARFGMFCIPGIARLEDIDLAARYGMGFIRVGTNVTEVEKSQPFIEHARGHGMYVTANFMKSYALEPLEFAEKALLTEKYGANLLYLVDSAGGMLPSDIEKYFKAVRDVSGISMGFHGHDNLGMAIANTLRAVEFGADIVDSSLQGFGRSSGNAATEILLVALKRVGMETGIDYYAAMDAGETYIRPLMRRRGYSSLDVITGLAQFHTSYMGLIRKYASRFRVDPRRLIEGVCAIDKVNAPPELVERVARQLRSEREEVVTARFDFDEYFGSEQNQK